MPPNARHEMHYVPPCVLVQTGGKTDIHPIGNCLVGMRVRHNLCTPALAPVQPQGTLGWPRNTQGAELARVPPSKGIRDVR